MASFEPEWIDVTWGAGGSTAQKTLEICATAQKYCGLETMMHLTCTNMPRAEIDDALRQAKDAGIQNILALRGGTTAFSLPLVCRLASCSHTWPSAQTLPVARSGRRVR
jgi:5,10-methylenetetrahydrofolate reductase